MASFVVKATHTGQGEGEESQWSEDSICKGCDKPSYCDMKRAIGGAFYRGWSVAITECDWYVEGD